MIKISKTTSKKYLWITILGIMLQTLSIFCFMAGTILVVKDASKQVKHIRQELFE